MSERKRTSEILFGIEDLTDEVEKVTNVSYNIANDETSLAGKTKINILTDGVATLTGGDLSGLTSISSTNLTDGTATLTGGDLSGLTSISSTTLTDGTAMLTGGDLSGLSSISSTTLTDGTAMLTGGDLTGLGDINATGTIANATDQNGNNPGILTSVLYLGSVGPDGAQQRINYDDTQGNGITPELWWYGERKSGQVLAGKHAWRFTSASGSSVSTVAFRNLNGDDNCVLHVRDLVESSDDRIKSNETPITDATTTLNKLTPLLYEQYVNIEKSDTPSNNAGLLAQQIYYDAPELRPMVVLNNDYTPYDLPVGNIETFNDIQEEDYTTTLNWGADVVSLRYSYLIPYLVKGIQELHKKQQESDQKQQLLEERILALENNNSVASQEVASEEVASEEVASEEVASEEVA